MCSLRIKKNIKKVQNPTVSYAGNYSHWKDAVANSSGYDDSKIINKATKSFEKVLAGYYKCERDTFLFDKYQYSLPLLLGLCFTQKKVGHIQLLDFGGSFASNYFRNLDVLQEFDLTWTVVEQKKIVQNAREMITGIDNVSFVEEKDLNNLITNRGYNVVLFGSCLQFFEKPHEIVAKLSHNSVKSIIIEQTPIVHNDTSKLTVQKVGSPLYEASYPAWHFAEKELISWFKDNYELKYTFNGPHIINKWDEFQSQLEDYVFTRREL
jgi:putative methyltransferase (TIGR04325 family)